MDRAYLETHLSKRQTSPPPDPLVEFDQFEIIFAPARDVKVPAVVKDAHESKAEHERMIDERPEHQSYNHNNKALAVKVFISVRSFISFVDKAYKDRQKKDT